MTTKNMDHSSVFSKGGGGNVFELSVQTAFVITLVVRGKMPGFPTGEITEIAFQTSRLGFCTDDILVKISTHQGEHKLLAQIKHTLPFTSKNETFEEVLFALWKDFNNKAVFNPMLDRLLIVKSSLTQGDRQDILPLLNWAKSKASATDFYLEVDRLESKQKSLGVFTEIIQKTSPSGSANKDLLWQFLRCLVILDYDFGQESSNSESNYINLIGLAKNPSSPLTAKDIWDSVFSCVAQLNKDGGSITLESVNSKPFITHFNSAQLSKSYASIKKMGEDSLVVFSHLKNSIAGLNLARTELSENLRNLLSTHRFTVVIGEPGTGKSALVKTVVSEYTDEATVLVFKADQFNESHLSKVFFGLGISGTLRDLSACLAAIPKKVIVIDSFERLLEGEPDNAFLQFLHMLKDIQGFAVIATSRTYAVELLIEKYSLNDISMLTVPLLSEERNGEFEAVLDKFPKLRPLADNQQIRQVLRSPKYLDFAVRWLETPVGLIGELTLTEFKNRLWQHIVENHLVVRDGMPLKRGKAFSEIALMRAQHMTIYVEPEKADELAIDELVNDSVLTKQTDENRYAPSHDILEDWALVKHVGRIRSMYSDPMLFFEKIGNKPALRRAFRLWVEECLSNQSATIFQLVRETLGQHEIERYWADEVLVAIFRSNQSKVFIEEFETELLQNQAELFQQVIHLLRTSCKKRKPDTDGSLLYPEGSGWGAVLSFAHQHLTDLGELRPLIVALLVDWSYILYGENDFSDMTEINPAKGILFSYAGEIEAQVNEWSKEPLKNRVRSLIDIIFMLTKHAQIEVKSIMERALPTPEDRYRHHDNTFYGLVRKMSLSGIYSAPLTKFLSEQVTTMAKAIWIRKPRRKKRLDQEQFSIEELEVLRPFIEIAKKEPESDLEEENYHSFERNRLFGFENHLHDSPSGIYKTPVYNLLWSNWQVGLTFLLEMVNHSTQQYIQTKEAREEGVIEVKIQISEDQWVTQVGTARLWQAYRGTSVTSYLLESLLMSLECYLLQTADAGTDISKKNLRFLYKYLLRHSTSAAISSVLVSVAIAYPEEVGEAMLPLLGVKEFYDWDLYRAIHEAGALAPLDFDISFAQNTRIKSNNLPHRKKYSNGLRGLLPDLQFSIKLFNDKLFLVLDKMWRDADEAEVYWRKVLHEIDVRRWQIAETDTENGTFIIQPSYESSVQRIVDDNQPRQAFQQEALAWLSWLREIYDAKNSSADYTTWREIYNNYRRIEYFDSIYHRPVTLAVIGLRDIADLLSLAERNWCIKILMNAIDELIIGVTRRREYVYSRATISPFDQEIALSSLPLLLRTVGNAKKNKVLITLLFRVLVAEFAENEIEPILTSLRNWLWEADHEIANRVWLSLILFAKVRQAHEKDQWHNPNDAILKKRIAKAEKLFIKHLVSDEISGEVIFDEITLVAWHSRLLVRAFIMLPYNTEDVMHYRYRKCFLPIFLRGLSRHSVDEEEFEEISLVHRDDVNSLQNHLRDYFLNCDYESSSEIAEILTNHRSQLAASLEPDDFEFVRWTFRRMISELGRIVYNESETIGKRTTENFWRIWETLYSVLNQSSENQLADLLFLDIEWDRDWTHWIPLEGKKVFLKRVADVFGKHDIRPLIRLLSTVGDQSLLPEGLHWIVKLIKEYPDNLSALKIDESEALIRRLYQRHIMVIKSDFSLLKDFIWILDQMVDLGSSQAYITRENLITYK